MDILGLKYKEAIDEKRSDIATSELNNEQKTNEMYKVITARTANRNVFSLANQSQLKIHMTRMIRAMRS